jgi:hypothetical protein
MRSPLANTRSAQYVLLRQRAYLQQIVHQTTHSLARFFLEVDANYKQFKTASRLRAAAAQRLEAQRAYYEEGRITIDRFLDAVSQYAQAVAQEAQFKTTYNISIVALEEAKGTLLAYNNIAVAEGPQPRKAYVQARDIQQAHRKVPIAPDGPMYRERVTGPVNPDPVPANPPPDVQPGHVPPLPAPVGPLGPPPTPVPPTRPAGEAPILSQNPPRPLPGDVTAPAVGRPASAAGDLPPLDGSTTPAGGAPAPMGATPAPMSGAPPAALRANLGAGSRPVVTMISPARVPVADPPPTAAATRPETADDLPQLPAEIALPPLPR